MECVGTSFDLRLLSDAYWKRFFVSVSRLARICYARKLKRTRRSLLITRWNYSDESDHACALEGFAKIVSIRIDRTGFPVEKASTSRISIQAVVHWKKYCCSASLSFCSFVCILMQLLREMLFVGNSYRVSPANRRRHSQPLPCWRTSSLGYAKLFKMTTVIITCVIFMQSTPESLFTVR